nr:glycosyltransferase family 1 protein [uncultured Trichococcus sp.]
MKPIRVLHVLNGLGSGGAESFIMNVYRNIDRSKVQFDFLIRSNDDNVLLGEVESLGGNVYITPKFPRHIFKNYKEVANFFKDHPEYHIVHLHANALMYLKPIDVAKKNGVRCRIIHSHNTQTADNFLYNYIHKWNKKYISKKATDFFACSNLAGTWMFENEYKLINNAIDVGKFAFDICSRNRIRKEFDIENKFVIGNVGRFTYQKNHDFLIDIFNAIHKINKNAILMLVGVGELIEDIKLKINLLGLQNSVIFAGVRKDIPDVLCAMDVFVFPSHFEGLGITLIEAQASGLHSLTSADVVPSEAKVTELLEYIPLDTSCEEWAKAVLKYQNGYIRGNTYDQIKSAGYDIGELAKKLEDYYLKQ